MVDFVFDHDRITALKFALNVGDARRQQRTAVPAQSLFRTAIDNDGPGGLRAGQYPPFAAL